MKNFKIIVADDYHEFDTVPKGFKVKEIGCFPHKNYPYNMYFAVQYRGTKPSKEEIWKEVEPLISYDLPSKVDVNRRKAMITEYVQDSIKEV